jgi:kynurenine formamidase
MTKKRDEGGGMRDERGRVTMDGKRGPGAGGRGPGDRNRTLLPRHPTPDTRHPLQFIPHPSSLILLLLLAACQPSLPPDRHTNVGVSSGNAAGQSAAGQSAAGQFPAGAVVDLSHAYDEQTVFWPTAEGFKLDKVADGTTPQGYYYAANNFSTAEHGGTHIDAPVHFASGRHTVDAIPLEQLIGRGVTVDVSEACAADRDYQITQQDLERWEREHGPLPDGAILLLRTGMGRHWPDREKYMGTNERGPAAVAKLHFPGLHPDAARWLVSNRKVKAVGLDTPSIDHGQSTLFETHRILFDRNVPAFENLANLERLPPKGFHVVALPMKIRGGSGGPLRAVALLER